MTFPTSLQWSQAAVHSTHDDNRQKEIEVIFNNHETIVKVNSKKKLRILTLPRFRLTDRPRSQLECHHGLSNQLLSTDNAISMLLQSNHTNTQTQAAREREIENSTNKNYTTGRIRQLTFSHRFHNTTRYVNGPLIRLFTYYQYCLIAIYRKM